MLTCCEYQHIARLLATLQLRVPLWQTHLGSCTIWHRKRNIELPTTLLTDIDGTMQISKDNPLIFTVEIIDGKLQPGDQVQICTRQLFTYDQGRRRKMRLRKEWQTVITESDVNSRFIFVPIAESPTMKGQRLFKTGASSPGTKTLSPLYVRVRRPIFVDGTEVDGLFSNIETVWKRYHLATSKIYIK